MSIGILWGDLSGEPVQIPPAMLEAEQEAIARHEKQLARGSEPSEVPPAQRVLRWREALRPSRNAAKTNVA